MHDVPLRRALTSATDLGPRASVVELKLHVYRQNDILSSELRLCSCPLLMLQLACLSLH